MNFGGVKVGVSKNLKIAPIWEARKFSDWGVISLPDIPGPIRNLGTDRVRYETPVPERDS